MKKIIKYGIICPSNIAEKRFLPALFKSENSEFVGMAHASIEEWQGATEEDIFSEKQKVQNILEKFGGKLFESYTSLIKSKEIDAVYIPLPPSLHYKWVKISLENGKHVLVEKPATTSLKDTQDLISIASSKELVLHENYMFAYHDQISAIKKFIDSGEIGRVRLFRLSFGFPKRAENDFRYIKKLGGGALLDCGGYNLKYATILLGNDATLEQAVSNYTNDLEVDLYGSAVMKNNKNQVAQLAFGMDNDYKCSIEVWGSLGTLYTNRIFTAPEGFVPTLEVSNNNVKKVIQLTSDDAFLKSIGTFEECIYTKEQRLLNYRDIELQANYIEEFITLSNKN